MKRKLQITRSVERKLLTLDEPQYEEVKNLLNDLLTDSKLLENSQKLEPDKDDNLLYTRLVNARLLDSDLYIVFAVHNSVIRVTDIIHKATVDYFKKQLANWNTAIPKLMKRLQKIDIDIRLVENKLKELKTLLEMNNSIKKVIAVL